MSIGRDDIMRIVRASRKPEPDRKGGISDETVMWLIIGGWALFVALLDSLGTIQRMLGA